MFINKDEIAFDPSFLILKLIEAKAKQLKKTAQLENLVRLFQQGAQYFCYNLKKRIGVISQVSYHVRASTLNF